jgi:hypothetical protein
MHEQRCGSGPEGGKPPSLLRWAALFALVAAAVQLAIPFPLDADTAYHAAVGRLIRQHGLLHAFPWTPFSWLADHYADKELLFHLLFASLANLTWTAAARIVGTLAGATLLLVTAAVLRSAGVKSPGLWALVPLAASFDFLYRFALVRPHVFSVALALAALWAASRNRLVVLAAIAVIYPWSYVAWYLPLVMVAIAETARLFCGRRPGWKPAAVALGCGAAGIALHPNAANLLGFTWLQIAGGLVGNAWQPQTGVTVGGEYLPPGVRIWTHGLLLCALLLASAAALWWRRRPRDPLTLAYVLAALAFAALAARSYRFVEYFAPFAVVACALAARSLPWRLLPHLVLGASLMYTVGLNSGRLLELGRRLDDLPPAAEASLRTIVPDGAQVFTPDWLFTGTLMLALPDRRFIEALEPTFFCAKDPGLCRLWLRISREAPPDTADLIMERFDARYAVCLAAQTWRPFISRLSSTPGVKTAVLDDTWVVFDLTERAGWMALGGGR